MPWEWLGVAAGIDSLRDGTARRKRWLVILGVLMLAVAGLATFVLSILQAF